MIVVAFAYFLFLYIDIRTHVNRAKEAIRDRAQRRQILEEHINKLNVIDWLTCRWYSVSLYRANYFLDEFRRTIRIEWHNSDQYHIPTCFAGVQFAATTSNIAQILFCHWTAWRVFVFEIGCCLWVIIEPSIEWNFYSNIFLLSSFDSPGFAFGLLIHSILQISYQVFFLSQTNANLTNCASITTLVLDIMFPIYSLFVLFFIFKYMNVIINEYRGLSRILLMHAIGTSLAFWVFTIVRETADAIALSDDKQNYSECFQLFVELTVKKRIVKYLQHSDPVLMTNAAAIIHWIQFIDNSRPISIPSSLNIVFWLLAFGTWCGRI